MSGVVVAVVLAVCVLATVVWSWPLYRAHFGAIRRWRQGPVKHADPKGGAS